MRDYEAFVSVAQQKESLQTRRCMVLLRESELWSEHLRATEREEGNEAALRDENERFAELAQKEEW